MRKIFRRWFLKMRYNRRDEYSKVKTRRRWVYTCPRCYAEMDEDDRDVLNRRYFVGWLGERDWIETRQCQTCGKIWETENGN